MKNKKDNFKNMKESELKKELARLEESIRVIRFKVEGSKSKNVKEHQALRREVARVLTFVNQYQNAK